MLRLDADNYPSVQSLDAAALTRLLAQGARPFVAVDERGEVLGYLMAFSSRSEYNGSEMVALRRRVGEPFFYIWEVVIAPAWRRQGMGRAFYAAIADVARREGVRVLCCGVNLDPPDRNAFAFHHALDFTEIGSSTASNGFTLAFLGKLL
ncbi:MAG: GNAT family N-acetyltransferase [Candidatus Didemnitutus sp.]|nr:GNAT family N-acetyltransferase [Candidatus Didemnitutus sp.]